MSNATFKDENKIDEEMKKVRDDSSGYTWITIGYTDDNKAVELKGSGQGDVDEFKKLYKEESCFYTIYRVTEKIDESITVKFALIKFMGEKVKPMQRGKIFSQTGSIQKKLAPFHVTHEGTLNEITEEKIVTLVGNASMNKSRVLDKGEVNEKDVVKTLKFTEKQTVNKSPQISKDVQIPKDVKESCSFKNPDEVKQAIQDVRNDESGTDWMLCCYEDPSKMKEIVFDSKGNGGVEELKKHVKEGNVYYGMVRVKDIIDGNETIKFAFIHVQSDKIKPMIKASLSTHKGVVDKMFSPVHVTVPVATTVDEFSQESVELLVQKTSNSKSNVIEEGGKKEEKKVETKKVEKKEEKKEDKGHDELLKDLETLAELKNQGIITEEEFNEKKKKILGL